MSTIDLGMDFQMPKNQSSQIKVMGIGGGGSNAVNYMFEHGIKGVDFVVSNTDSQALEASSVPIKIQLGINLTEGLGAGSNPEVGRKAAEESADRITELLDANTKMLFLTAGMGGGTGTGASPVIAEIAREKGILTVAVVTIPFITEGGYRKQYADEGISELKKYVDTLLVINNEKLIEVYGDLTFTEAFGKANEVLNTATKGIAEVISQHLLVNIDLNDARKVLENSGTAVMGQSKAEGENRAIEAVTQALDSPLLNDNDITGAQQVLLKIVTGDGDSEIRMSELAKIKNKIQESAGSNVNIIEGIGIDSELGASVSVTVIATGFKQKRKPKGTTIVDLEDKGISKELSLDMMNDDSKIINDSNCFNSLAEECNTQHTLDLKDENYSNSSDHLINLESNSIPIQIDEIDQRNVVLELDHDSNESSKKIITEIPDSKDSVSDTLDLQEDNEETSVPINEDELLNINHTKVSADSMKVEARERENRLRAISQQLRTPSGLTNLEDVPAYKRNNIELHETTHSSEQVSTYSLGDADDSTTELRQNNSFLHDNVD